MQVSNLSASLISKEEPAHEKREPHEQRQPRVTVQAFVGYEAPKSGAS
jgi:hypothetical protein